MRTYGVEYRVVWRREGLSVKTRVYKKRASAERRVGLMTDPEPWKFMGKNPTAFVCCSGHECGCGGETVKEEAMATRARLPKLLYARIESRSVGQWEAEQEPTS